MTLLLQSERRIEIGDYLLGHLMNCAMYSQDPLYIQAPLVGVQETPSLAFCFAFLPSLHGATRQQPHELA